MPFADHLQIDLYGEYAECFFAQLPSAEPWNPYGLSSFGFIPSISRPDSVYGQHDALSRQAYCFHSIRSGHQVIRPKRTPQKRWISCHSAPQYLCISKPRPARLVLLSGRAPSVPRFGTVGAISWMQEARDGRERPLKFTQSFCAARKDVCNMRMEYQASIETDADLPDLATWCRRLDLYRSFAKNDNRLFASSCIHEVNG